MEWILSMRFERAFIVAAALALLGACDTDRHDGERLESASQQEDTAAPEVHPDATNLEHSLEQYRRVLFDKSRPLAHFLIDVTHHYRIPALAAAVTTLDGIQSKAVVGVKNYHRPEKATIDDIFCIGSCAKSMTATLIASMVEEGLIRWDSRPLDVFPELKGTIHPGFHDITVKQLLSHTAGIQQFVSDEAVFGVHETIEGLHGSTSRQRRNFAFWNLKRRPATTPGAFSYSNGGYIIVAAMAEKLAGVPWETLMKRRVFGPLGLQSAFVGMPQDQSIENVRRHYDRDADGNPIPLAPHERSIPALFNPTGMVSISITDFAKYALFHLRGLNGLDAELKAQSLNYLHRSVAHVGGGFGYALGWNTVETDNLLISTHSGGDSSVYAVIGIDRRNRVAAVVMCNMGDAQATAACANVMLEVMP